jgi:hypothetical protein
LMTGMLIAFCGGFLMVGESLHLEPRFLIGDLLALLAAIFYSGYLIVVKRLRRGRSTWYVMAWTGIFAAPTMFLISAATRETLLPKTLFGWEIVLALALISQLGGQGMIAYGLAHLSASVSAVLLMWAARRGCFARVVDSSRTANASASGRWPNNYCRYRGWHVVSSVIQNDRLNSARPDLFLSAVFQPTGGSSFEDGRF